MKELRQLIRDLREDHDLTQREVASHLGVSQQTYSNYENGVREIPTSTVVALAKFYQVSTDYLLGRADRTGPSSETGYYLDAETARLAQEMYEDKDMRSLFDMKRNMPPERFKAHLDFMKNLYEQEQYQSMVMADLRQLDGERAVIRYEREQAEDKKQFLRRMAIGSAVLVVILFLTLFVAGAAASAGVSAAGNGRAGGRLRR